VTKCLQQLQKTNPSLLLTTSELRKAERDARYVPAVSLALASILTKSVSNPDSTILERIQQWGSIPKAPVPSTVVVSTEESSQLSVASSNESKNDHVQHGNEFSTESVEQLGLLIEERLRLVIAQSEKKKSTKSKKKEVVDSKEHERGNDVTSVASSLDQTIEGLDIDWDLLQQEFEQEKSKKATTSKAAWNGGNAAALGTASGGGGTQLDDDSEQNSDFEDWL